MKQTVLLVIIAIIGLGVGLAGGVVITNSKSKPVVADLQSKLQQSEAASQKRSSDYAAAISRLNNELQQSKTELENLRASAQTAAAAESENTASDSNSIPAAANLYTVKEGDSLWKIAASQLGDSNRYKEIVKLNPNVSANGKNLSVGSKLKLPAR